MNLLDSDKYADEDEFFEKFGGGKDEITLEQVHALQVGTASKWNSPILCNDAQSASIGSVDASRHEMQCNTMREDNHASQMPFHSAASLSKICCANVVK